MTAMATVAPPTESSIITGFGYSPLQPALWRQGETDGLECRDLSLAPASNGALRARHIRALTQTSTSGVGAPDEMFAFIFVLSGDVSLTDGLGQVIHMGPSAAACRDGAGAGRWTLSPGAEIIEVIACEPLWPADKPGVWRVSHDGPDAYVMGDGPRRYFSYRDLGVAAATDRRIHIHIVRASEALDGGTGWHRHTMGQLFYVLRGHADLAVEDRPWVRMTAGDAMCLGPGMRHNVPGFSADYLVLEMCVPADYDTTDVDAPRS